MAKDFAEIKQRVEYYIDDTITPDIAMLLFNQCNEDISWLAAYGRTVESDFDREEPFFTLPEDFIEALEIKFKPESSSEYLRVLPIGLVQPTDVWTSQYGVDSSAPTGYELFGDSIEIRSTDLQSGLLQLRYYALLPTVATLGDVPQLKARWHDLYALFAAAKYYQNYQDELNAKTDYWSEYQQKRMELEREFYRIKSRSQSKTVYQYRRWS